VAIETDLKEEIIKLGPWHLDVEVKPGLTTRVSLDAPPGSYPESLGTTSFQAPRRSFRDLMQAVYPDGLGGRSVLDCACNCGAYLFWAQELGAGRCFGFDVREHWIRQARFLQRHRAAEGGEIDFEVRDLYELPDRGLEPFDITLFNGIFYHLPEPVGGLRLAADLTTELIMIDTATRSGREDGMLAVGLESREKVMSGVHGLMWRPTGPRVLERILEYVGFEETALVEWKQEAVAPGWGRLQMIGSKKPGLLAGFQDRLAAISEQPADEGR
jgi:tRNA (mo5U34)-methyltransferase